MSSGRRWGEAVAGIVLGAFVLVLVPAGPSLSATTRMTAERPSARVGAVGATAPKDKAVDVVDYTLQASLDATIHVVHGEGTIVWRNTSRVAVRELWLHLYLNAFKNERTAFLRAPIGSGRGTSPVTSWGYIDVHKLVARELDGADLWPGADKTSPGDPDDETDIRVPLPRSIEPGETLTLDTAWEAKLPNIVERTGFADDFHMVAQWFPKVARLEPSGEWRHFPFYHLAEFYADFGTYDVTIDVPRGTVVGATGVRVSSASENGRDRFVYHQSDVHDFAWVAWPLFREKTAQAEGVELRVLYPPGYSAVAEREIAMVAFGLRYFGEHYGRYPYPTLTLVHPPPMAGEAGGMEYPTLITTGGAWYSPPFLHDVEVVTIHELAHQYFYGMVATDEERWPVLDEGLTSFAESDALTARFGDGWGLDFMGYRVSAVAMMRAGSLRAAHNEPVARSAETFASGADYAELVYGRTTAVLETIARVYGRDLFNEALGRYARRYRFEHPTLHDFMDTMREVLGAGAVSNLEVALQEKGWVDYLVAEAASAPDADAAGVFDHDGRRETIMRGTPAGSTWHGSALVIRRGTLKFPVDIELWGADGTKQLAHWDGAEDWIRLPYQGKSELGRVMVDPAVTVVVDENLLNNGFRIAPRASTERTLERVTYFAELALHWLMP